MRFGVCERPNWAQVPPLTPHQATTRLLDVPADLFLQGVDAREPPLRAQAMLEGEFDPPPIQVAVEVEQMRLGHQPVPGLKGRATPEVRDGGKDASRRGLPRIQEAQRACVDPRRGKNL